jgi:hypothetical protein
MILSWARAWTPTAAVLSGLVIVAGCAQHRPTAVGKSAAAGGDPVIAGVAAPTSALSSPCKATLGGAENRSAHRIPPPMPVAIVAVDVAAQRASVAEAVRSGKYPERLSALIAPVAFDRAAYLRDPAGYLNVVEPGRVLQPADAGQDVPALAIVGSEVVTIPELGSTTLAVQSVPRGPVSFASLDMGAFDNGLGAITVQADDQGIARTTYTATRGTIAQARIAIASPVASGTGTMLIQITAAGATP